MTHEAVITPDKTENNNDGSSEDVPPVSNAGGSAPPVSNAGGSATQQRLYSAVIPLNGSGGTLTLNMPTTDPKETSGQRFKQVSRPHRKPVIRGTATVGHIRGVPMTRRRSVFVYRLEDCVTMEMMNDHLVSNGIKGAKLRKMSSKDAIYTSYKVDLSTEFYDKICDSSLWGTGVKST